MRSLQRSWKRSISPGAFIAFCGTFCVATDGNALGDIGTLHMRTRGEDAHDRHVAVIGRLDRYGWFI